METIIKVLKKTNCYSTPKPLGNKILHVLSSLTELEVLHIDELFLGNTIIDDNSICKIVSNCKQLKEIKICFSGDKSNETQHITDKSLYSISQLTNIRKIIFQSSNSHNNINLIAPWMPSTRYTDNKCEYGFTDSGVISLINCCKEIDFLQILSCYNLTQLTINAIISIAKLSPNKFIYVNFDSNDELKSFNFSQLLPKNLKIEI